MPEQLVYVLSLAVVLVFLSFLFLVHLNGNRDTKKRRKEVAERVASFNERKRIELERIERHARIQNQAKIPIHSSSTSTEATLPKKSDTCSFCHGSGRLSCAACHGTGNYDGGRTTGRDQDPVIENCRSCGGWGDSNTLCPKCRGSGGEPFEA